MSEKNKKKMGRPLKEINQQQFEKLCQMQCTEEEICGFFDVSHDTLDRWCLKTYTDDEGNPLTFAKTFKIKRQAGKISLRRMQWQIAETNANMAIFLGKNFLGQSERGEIDDTDDLNRVLDKIQESARE